MIFCSCELGEGRGGDEQDGGHLSQGVQGSFNQGRKPVRTRSYQKQARSAWVCLNCRFAEIVFATVTLEKSGLYVEITAVMNLKLEVKLIQCSIFLKKTSELQVLKLVSLDTIEGKAFA
jgi:hypothetical protein